MINVQMVANHGLSVSFQVESWEEVYFKINEEVQSPLRVQPIALAYAAESQWDEDFGRYEIVKAEYFLVTPSGRLASVGPDTDLQLHNGRLKKVR